MEEERVTTIIHEIKYWKEHKLLPDQYCDFLLALYTNGEEIERQSNNNSKVLMTFQLLIIAMMLPFSFLVLYFTELHVYLQLGILTLFLIYAFWGFLYFKKRNDNYYHLSLMVSLFILLLFSLQIGHMLFNQVIISNIIIFINFIFWLFISRIYKLSYLFITSILGIIFVIIYIFLQNNSISL